MSAPQYPGQQPYPMPPVPPPPRKMSGCVIAIIVAVAVAIPGLGIFAALGIYGVRRYMAAAKTAEAKNNVGAISRAAVSGYESERFLCGSAIAVPTLVPKGTKYMPSAADFATGDARNGWSCLKFSMTTPFYYQYQYHAGSGYVTAPAAALGPRGFEALAEGDLNADDVHSRFARTGVVDAAGTLTLSTQIYVENEFE